MRISDWSSDVFSSDLGARQFLEQRLLGALIRHRDEIGRPLAADLEVLDLVEITPQPRRRLACGTIHDGDEARMRYHRVSGCWSRPRHRPPAWHRRPACPRSAAARSEEHTSELQSLMRTSYAVFCLKN